LAEVALRRGALLLDSGAVSAIAEGNVLARAALVRARTEGRQVAIPAAVLAEITTDHPSHVLVDRVVKAVDLEVALLPARARETGRLRSRAATERHVSRTRRKDTVPSVVDATIMAEALALGAAVVLTTDTDDMRRLRDSAGVTPREVQVIRV
jgi:rRNA-processing protein FCF1